jgi:hypothetical protein
MAPAIRGWMMGHVAASISLVSLVMPKIANRASTSEISTDNCANLSLPEPSATTVEIAEFRANCRMTMRHCGFQEVNDKRE